MISLALGILSVGAPQPVEGLRQVPVEEGGSGVQPQAERGLPKEEAQTPVAPQVGPQAVGAAAQPMTPVRQIALDELKRQGWNPKWPFVQADLLNESFRDAIRADPTLSAEEKSKILSFGPKDEPTSTPKVEPTATPIQPVDPSLAKEQIKEIIRTPKELEQDLRKEGWNVTPVKITGSKNLVDYWEVSYRAQKVSEADTAQEGWNKIADGKVSAPKEPTAQEKFVKAEIDKREAEKAAASPAPALTEGAPIRPVRMTAEESRRAITEETTQRQQLNLRARELDSKLRELVKEHKRDWEQAQLEGRELPLEKWSKYAELKAVEKELADVQQEAIRLSEIEKATTKTKEKEARKAYETKGKEVGGQQYKPMEPERVSQIPESFGAGATTMAQGAEKALTEGGAPEAGKPTAPAKRKGIERPWDIIDELLSTVGTIRRKSAAKPGTEGYYTPEFHALSQSGASRKLFGPTGASPDEALSGAIKSGMLGESATVGDLEVLISRANAQRRAISQGRTPEIQADKFQTALSKQAAKKGSHVISVGDLGKGDKFRIQGEEFEVVSIDPDTGEVTVKDGKKFGHQTIPDGADIPVEKGSFEQVPQVPSFGEEDFALNAPESVEQQKARLAHEEEVAKAKAEREKLVEATKKPLVGATGDIGQMDMLGGGDLFSQPKGAEPSVGPGAASPGPGAAATGEPGTYSAIQQLSDRMATAPAKTMRERISFGERMADKATQFKSAVTRTMAKARAIPTAIKSMRSGLRNMNDVTRLVGELDYALQRSAGLSDQAAGEIKKGIVNDSMRNGTAIWIDAGGDESAIRNALANLPAGTKAGVRRAMEAALRLPDDVKEKAKDLSDYFAVRAQEAVQEGIFKEALEDYFTHIWKNRDNMPESVKGALNSGRVNEYFQFGRKRTIPTLLEGIMQGKEPLLDPAAVVPFYNYALDRAIASRRFIKQLQNLKSEDGRPVVAPSGEGKLIQGIDNDYLLVKTTVTPKQLEGYRAVDHPALKKWKWAATDPESGREVFYEGNLLVHPDHFERIARMMDRSRLTPWKGTQALLRASGEVKGFKLGVASFFHPVQVGTHAMFHLTKPWVSGEPINWDSPRVKLAIEKGGLQLAADFRLKEQFAEGILSPGLVNKIPGIGPLSRALSDWTFSDYIPKLKLQTFETILDRDMKRYAKQIASGKVTEEQVIARAGDAANNAFGELNRLWLGKTGRDPTTQRMLRLIFLAPDFGEARARFIGKALTSYGGEERLALGTAVVSLYLAARIGNILSHGDAEVEDPKHMFDVRVGERWWGIRSIVGDLRHLWDRPRQFWEVRLNPLYARTALAALSGRDPRGHKFTGITDFAADIGKQFVPIHLGALTRDDQKLWESFAQSIGAQTWKGSATAEIHRVAQDWRKAKGITDSTEILAGFDSPYRKARLALEFNDPRKFGEALQEIEANLHARKDPSPRKTIESNFKRYYAMPFSGNNRLETNFRSSLDARDRKLYQEAQTERKALYQKFKSWY